MKKQKLPKLNGRPQLWSRRDFRGLRIIFPDGRVHWWREKGENDTWANSKGKANWEIVACTSAVWVPWYHPNDRQLDAIKNCIEFDIQSGCPSPEFLGYL